MSIIIREILAKSALTPSRIEGIDFALNPYTGCAHGCRYCYADFMKRFSNHNEPWGSFVDVKVNIPQLLEKELQRRKYGTMNFADLEQGAWRMEHGLGKLVSLSTVTDPYQPLERKYQLTRRCLEILLRYQMSVSILTKSPLVLRDVDLIKQFKNIDVGMTITTDREEIRKIFEPCAPPIQARIDALKQLHQQGIKTWVFVGPILPMDPNQLGNLVKDFIHYYYIDLMNYIAKSRTIYYQYQLQDALRPAYFEQCKAVLENIFNDGL
ncbi:MAG: radical SAM protein [bacterium]|jgi:DNA repair photolyase|nr:radical SAM protein [bacterium]